MENVFKNNTIDLGLPSGTLWTEMNLCANKINDIGGYTAFGNIQIYSPNEISEYNLFSDDCRNNSLVENNVIKKYTPYDGVTIIQPEDDIAKKSLGNKFSIPSVSDFQELINNTTQAICTFNNEKCLKMKSKINDAEILFPCTGWASWGQIKFRENGGVYMTSNMTSDFISSYVFVFDSSNAKVEILDCAKRFIGLTVRAICKNS